MARRKTRIVSPDAITWVRADPERRVAWVIVCVLLMAAIVYVDFLLGRGANLFILQIIPVVLATWKLGRAVGVAFAIAGPLLTLPTELTWAAGIGVYTLVFNELLRIAVFVMIAIGLAQIRIQGEELARLSMTDPLTALGNRRAFIKRGVETVARARRTPQPITLIFIDLDNFKQVNDRHGHDTGDTVLQTVANAIRGALRDTDHAARLGGDEFAIILYNAGAAGARHVAEKIRERIALALAQTELGVTASIGVATFNQPPENFDAALSAADMLMYEVKSDRKNDVAYRVYEPDSAGAPAATSSPKQ
jgi:diguanylate cyclase (GGDEF)-like protein